MARKRTIRECFGIRAVSTQGIMNKFIDKLVYDVYMMLKLWIRFKNSQPP